MLKARFNLKIVSLKLNWHGYEIKIHCIKKKSVRQAANAKKNNKLDETWLVVSVMARKEKNCCDSNHQILCDSDEMDPSSLTNTIAYAATMWRNETQGGLTWWNNQPRAFVEIAMAIQWQFDCRGLSFIYSQFAQISHKQ